MGYVTSDNYNVPDEGETIWRYMTFEQLLSLLQKQELHFHRADCFDDPFEGTVPKAITQLREEGYREDHEEDSDTSIDDLIGVHSRVVRKTREYAFLNCWHINSKGESAAMWDQYGEIDKAIAIKSTFGSLVKSLDKTDVDIHGAQVYYTDFHSDIDEVEPLERKRMTGALGGSEQETRITDSLIFKRNSFEHEQEFRLMDTDFDVIPRDEFDEIDYNIDIDGETYRDPLFVYQNDQWGAVDFREPHDSKGKGISVDIDSLINEIRISPGADDWFESTVEKAVENSSDNRLTKSDVRQSDSKRDRFF